MRATRPFAGCAPLPRAPAGPLAALPPRNWLGQFAGWLLSTMTKSSVWSGLPSLRFQDQLACVALMRRSTPAPNVLSRTAEKGGWRFQQNPPSSGWYV